MRTLAISALLATVAVAPSALALQPDGAGWYHTGDAVRQKTVVFITANVYQIGHDMKCVVPHSKQAVIDADCDKKFTWRMMRDVGSGKIVDAMKEAYDKNGYHDGGKINQALGAFNAEFKNGATVTISYNAANKTTTFWEQGGGSATVAGIDFMKATWSVWFGRIDPPSFGDRLIANL
ncbi:MAG TPA: chalcone isomerase family protein [Polyangiaceae bacterium]|jgi:hypothetical protein